MNIIIVGGGKVGTELVRLLSLESHNIVVVDINNKVIEEVVGNHDVMGLCGDGACCDVLEKAKVASCDIIIATTDSDERNVLCCLIARKMKARHCIARVRNPSYAEQLVFMREELGLSMMVNPEYQAAREISRLLKYPSAIDIETFGRGLIDMVEFKIIKGSALEDVSLKEIYNKISVRVLICAVQRDGEVYIPNGDFILRKGDKIHFTAVHSELLKFFHAVDSEKGRIKSVMIIGGGTISFYLAELLAADMGMQVKIIEKNLERCIFLSDSLPKAHIIHGDGGNYELIEDEGIVAVDACVTLTGMDEENIITSLFAKSKGTKKVVTKINRVSAVNIAENVGLESVVSPKNITADMILQYVRARQNSKGSNILTLYRLLDGKAEAIEFIVRQKAHYVDVPIKDLKLNKNSIIASIIRNNKHIIPNGSDRLCLHDSVVVVSTNKFMNDLNDIFKV
ncbi:MAG: Trk system potassium transporter TrkA [Eubacterium sp.]|jgi:trk system potassium uptake protein TrkA|nr:Trk system potassium transporter TrkA [Eubacterium sp.]